VALRAKGFWDNLLESLVTCRGGKEKEEDGWRRPGKNPLIAGIHRTGGGTGTVRYRLDVG